jgi:hypothetical protein
MRYRLVLVTAAALAFGPAPAGGAELKVGQLAPVVDAVFADGDALRPEQLNGKVVLMTFWSAEDAAARRHFEKMREVRREFVRSERFQMVSVRLGGDFADWLKFQEKQRPHDERFPRQPFYSDAKWWQAFHYPARESRRNPFGVGQRPESFLIGPDGKLLAVRLADDALRAAVAKALERRQ